MMHFHEVVSALGAKHEGNEWRSGCPICYGRVNCIGGHSMIISRGETVQAIFKNFKCSHTSGEVHQWLKENLAGYWKADCKADPVQVLRKSIQSVNPSKKVATVKAACAADLAKIKSADAFWIYRNKCEEITGAVLRHNKRDRKGKPDKAIIPWLFDGKDQWTCIGFQKPWPLYGLHLLAKDASATVVLVEGEKSADAANGLLQTGFVSLSPHGGCKRFNGGDYEPLRGRRVVVIPDNDEAGKQAMAWLTRHLAGMGCEVSLAEIPAEFPEGWDVADTWPDGWDMVRLLELTKRFVPAETDTVSDESDVLDFTPTTTICQTDFPDLRWIVRDLLPEGLAMLSAAPKAGKTLLVTELAACIATGRPFLGYETTQGTVIYFDAESDERGLKHRMCALGWDKGANCFVTHHTKPGWQLDAANLAKLDKTVEAYPDLRLIIIDTLERLIPQPANARSLDAYQAGVKRLSALQAWVRQKQIGMLLIHHTKKGKADGEAFDAASGSRGLTGTVEIPMTLSRDTGDTFLLNVTSRYAPSMELLLERDGAKWKLLGSPAEAKMTDDQQAIYNHVKQNPGGTPKKIAKATGITHGTVCGLLRRMSARGLLKTCGRGKYEINSATQNPSADSVSSVSLSVSKPSDNYKITEITGGESVGTVPVTRRLSCLICSKPITGEGFNGGCSVACGAAIARKGNVQGGPIC